MCPKPQLTFSKFWVDNVFPLICVCVGGGNAEILAIWLLYWKIYKGLWLSVSELAYEEPEAVTRSWLILYMDLQRQVSYSPV